MRSAFCSFIIALLTCVGCAQVVAVTVKGTSGSEGPIPSHVTYAVLPVAEVEKTPLSKRYAELVERQMDAHDYKKTSERTAHLGVLVTYATRQGGSRTPAAGIAGAMSPAAPGGSGGYGVTTGTAPSSTGPSMYTHQLVIVVVDLKKSPSEGPIAELWRGDTMAVDTSKEMGPLAPLMVEAAFRHLGDNTATQVRHLFTEEEAKQLREGK